MFKVWTEPGSEELRPPAQLTCCPLKHFSPSQTLQKQTAVTSLVVMELKGWFSRFPVGPYWDTTAMKPASALEGHCRFGPAGEPGLCRPTVSGPDSSLNSGTFSDEDRKLWVGLFQTHIVMLHKVPATHTSCIYFFTKIFIIRFC